MITTAILNAVLALGVIVMVITPLVWATLTQHRDNPRPAATNAAQSTCRRATTVGVPRAPSTSMSPDLCDLGRVPDPAGSSRVTGAREPLASSSVPSTG